MRSTVPITIAGRDGSRVQSRLSASCPRKVLTARFADRGRAACDAVSSSSKLPHRSLDRQRFADQQHRSADEEATR